MKFKNIILLFFSFFSVHAQDFSQPFQLESYLGEWYQVYSNKIVLSTFEKDAKCISSFYGIYGKNNISVYNEEYNIKDKKESIRGYAYIPDYHFPRKLIVYLNGGSGDAPYWIYELGPLLNHQYQYSIVSDPYKLFLFVLTRNITLFMEEYNKEVLRKLEVYGFHYFYNKPILTKQDHCPT